MGKHGPNYRCKAKTCEADECCKPTCKSVLKDGQCPTDHSEKVDLRTTACVGCVQETAVAKCCVQHPKCPACKANELPKHGPNYRCKAKTCEADECCKPTCKSVLKDGQCPASHKPKV